MAQQFRNPISFTLVVFLCISVVSIPSEGAVNNGFNAQPTANNGSTIAASTNNGATNKAAVNNKPTTKVPGNPGSTPFDLQSTLSQLLPSSIGDAVKQAAQALDLLKYAFLGSPPEHTPSSECLEDVTEFLKGVLSRQMWALKSKCFLKVLQRTSCY